MDPVLYALIVSSFTYGYVLSDTLYDFTGEDPSSAWAAVNDGVMGGLSRGSAELVTEGMRFAGILSLENNGGFSSIREPARLQLSDYTGIRLKVKGDGRSYQLRLETDERLWNRFPVSFYYEFSTLADEWMIISIPFKDLKQSWRGRQLEGFTFDPSQIRMIGLLIGDKREGPFILEIATISGY